MTQFMKYLEHNGFITIPEIKWKAPMLSMRNTWFITLFSLKHPYSFWYSCDQCSCPIDVAWSITDGQKTVIIITIWLFLYGKPRRISPPNYGAATARLSKSEAYKQTNTSIRHGYHRLYAIHNTNLRVIWGIWPLNLTRYKLHNLKQGVALGSKPSIKFKITEA